MPLSLIPHLMQNLFCHYTYKKLAWILDKRFRGWQWAYFRGWQWVCFRGCQKCCYSALDAESRKYFFLLMLERKEHRFLFEDFRNYGKWKKVKKAWIPNQVGDDNGMVFGDDSYCGSSIKDFEDDSGCAFEDDKSVVVPHNLSAIPHLMRNPGSIYFHK